MRRRTWALLCAPALLIVAPAAARGPARPPIQVTAPEVTVQQWSARIGSGLGEAMGYPSPLAAGRFEEGLARVSFRCSDTGLPAEVALAGSSGSPRIDAAALNAVRHLGSMHPLPAGIGMDRPFEAWLVFADSQASADRLIERSRHALPQFASSQRTGQPVDPAAPLILIASR